MRLTSIKYTFPEDSSGVANELLNLLSLCPVTRREKDFVEISAGGQNFKSPTTRLAVEDIQAPKIEFEGTGFPSQTLQSAGRSAQDWLQAECVELREVVRMLRGHVTWVDHTGINLPADGVEGPWVDLVTRLGESSLMYAYPTGEPWFFIVPGDATEHMKGITEFTPHSTPRFELVELSPGSRTAVQIDIQTDLSRSDLIRMFPGRKSVSLPGLEDYFLSLFVNHPWKDLEIRLDLRFGPGKPDGLWETGEWLVVNGTRCDNQMHSIPRA